MEKVNRAEKRKVERNRDKRMKEERNGKERKITDLDFFFFL